MSMANVTSGRTGPENLVALGAALTPKEAAKIGIPEDEYESAVRVRPHGRRGAPASRHPPRLLGAHARRTTAWPTPSSPTASRNSQAGSRQRPTLPSTSPRTSSRTSRRTSTKSPRTPSRSPPGDRRQLLRRRGGGTRRAVRHEDQAGPGRRQAPPPPRQRAAPAARDLGPVDRGGGFPHLRHLLPQRAPAATVAGLARLVLRRDGRHGHHPGPDLAGAPRRQEPQPRTGGPRRRQPPRGSNRGSPGATGTSG